MVARFLPPGLAHKAADLFLSLYSQSIGIKKPPEWRPLEWKNLYFPNPLAPAGGVDKSAKHLKAWWALGAGFIEVGTVTPLPQKKNPGPTLKRDWKTKTLWNHLGFPGDGAEAVRKRLAKLSPPTPVFANIGKNRNTPNETAHEDYLKCISALYPYVSAFVINVSSPNTKDLRKLSRPRELKKLLLPVREKLNSFQKAKPFFVKWSADSEERDFLQSLDTALECGAEGHIISNSSACLNNALIKGKALFPPGRGGISGAPVSAGAKQRLQLTIKHLGAEKKNQLIISVGGILKPEEVLERLNMGADLTQTYSALVFQGPFFLKKTGALIESQNSQNRK